MEKKYIRENDVSKMTGIPIQTLRNHRSKCRGLPYVKFGRAVLYDIKDVCGYLDSRKIIPDVGRK
jgi:hypothetical protein